MLLTWDTGEKNTSAGAVVGIELMDRTPRERIVDGESSRNMTVDNPSPLGGDRNATARGCMDGENMGAADVAMEVVVSSGDSSKAARRR